MDLTTMMSTEAPQEDNYYAEVAEQLFIIVIPIITFVGLFGNIMTIIVMCRRSHRASSVSVYLLILAISDSLVLILDFINNWFKYRLDIFLLKEDNGFCKFHRTMFNVIFTYSSWLVVAVSVERFIAVWFPLKAKQLCTAKSALIVSGVLFLIAFACYAYKIPGWELDGEGECNMHIDYKNFEEQIGSWWSAVLYSYAPIIILIIVNGLIIIRLNSMASKRETMTTQEKSMTAEKRITVTVVVICIVFVLLTLPVALFYILQFSMGEFIQQRPSTALAESIILILGLTNYAINFFLYVLTSAAFRKEVVAVFCCRRRRHSDGSSIGTGSSLAVTTTNYTSHANGSDQKQTNLSTIT